MKLTLVLCAVLALAPIAHAKGFLGIGDGKPGVAGIGDGKAGVAGIGDNKPGALGIGDGKAGALGVGEKDTRPECCRKPMSKKEARKHARWHERQARKGK